MPSHPDRPESIDRRQAITRLAIVTTGLLGGCKLGEAPPYPETNDGRLAARPTSQMGFPSPGGPPLLLDATRDGRLYVPPGLTSGVPAPLILLLHGASGNGQSMLTALQSYADEVGAVLLCPDSRGFTWDAIQFAYADDIEFINSALQVTFGKCNIDPNRIGIAGFSDGASYSIALGRINGDLFKRMVAFSPGMLLPAHDEYKPPLYLTHGFRDTVLPMELTSVPISEQLKARGYEVTFRQFDGGHWMPKAFVPEAFRWLLTGNLDVTG
ncbi:MAG TPA: PHB depolymerase family esterase [Gemmatimonadaceae bacterium]